VDQILNTLPFLQWGTADAELKDPSVENLQLTIALPLKPASEYSHTCPAHCQEFLHHPNFDFPGPFWHSPSFFFFFLLLQIQMPKGSFFCGSTE